MSTTDLACTTALITGATAASAKPPPSRWPIGAPMCSSVAVTPRVATRLSPRSRPRAAKQTSLPPISAALTRHDRSLAGPSNSAAATWTSWSTTPPSSPWVRPRKLAKEDIDAAFAVNVKVPFVLVAELAPAMAARGKGAIINIGTVAAEFGIPGMSLYGATKASLVLLTTPHSGLLGPDRPSILR